MHGFIFCYKWPHVVWKPADKKARHNSYDNPKSSLKSPGSFYCIELESVDNQTVTDKDYRKREPKHDETSKDH